MSPTFKTRWKSLPGIRLDQRWRLLVVSGLVLLGAGLRFGAIADRDEAIASPVEIVGEIRDVGLSGTAAGAEGPTPLEVLTRHADGGARLWKWLWFRLEGQWDARLMAVADVALMALAAAVFWLFVVRSTGLMAAGMAALGGTCLMTFQNVIGLEIGRTDAWAALLLLCSGLHVGLVVTSRPDRWPWWAGQVAGVAAVLASAAGVGSSVILLAWAACGGAREPSGRGRTWPVVTGAAATLAVGVVVAWVRGDRWLGGGFSPGLLRALLGWPSLGWAGVLLTCAPLLVQVARIARARERSDGEPLMLGLCLWPLVLAAAVAAGGPEDAAASVALATFARVVGMVAAADLLFRVATRRPVWVGLVIAWLGLGIIGLARTGPADGSRPEGDSKDSVDANRAFRQYLADGDVEDLSDGLGMRGKALADLVAALDDRRVVDALPVTLRRPLAVTPAAECSTAFQARDVPALDLAPAGLPTWGSWAGGEPHRVGEWCSEAVRTRHRMLQVFVAGGLTAPKTRLVLRTADGREIEPLDVMKLAHRQWTRVNFVAPQDQPFSLVARSSTTDGWFAFSAPVEWGGLTWCARKLANGAGWWVAAGVLALMAALAAMASRWRDEVQEREALTGAVTRVIRVSPWVAMFLVTVLLSAAVDDNAAGADSAGYLNFARMLLDGRLLEPARMVEGLDVTPAAYVPLGFRAVGDGLMAPTYPVGMPLLFALAGSVTSLGIALPVVILGHFLLGAWLTQRLARACGQPAAWAWLAAAFVACCPLYVFMGVQPMSDGASLAWVTAAMLAALRSRENAWFSLLAGVATSLAVLIRPANALCFVPALMLMGLSWRRLGGWVLGGLPGGLWQLWLNQHLFGNPFETGYENLAALFRWATAGPTVVHYAVWLTAFCTPLLVFVVPGLRARGLAARVRLALAVWAGVFLGFYAFYAFTHETWWYLRFVLPAVPPLVVLMLAGVRDVGARCGVEPFATGGWRPVLAGVVLFGLPLVNLVFWSWRLPIVRAAEGNRVYPEATQWMTDHVPPGAVVMSMQASGALLYYTDFTILRYDAMPAADLARTIRRLEELRRPVYALVFSSEADDAWSRLPGRWTQVGTVRHTTVWRFEAFAPPGS